MSGTIKTIKAKDDNNIEQNIFPKTVLEAVVDSETNETLDNILADKVSKTDIVDNLESTATDAPLSAKQGKVVNDKVDDYIAENLIPYPYFQTSCTNENIVYTDNGDGTINANGTATGSFSGFTCRLYNEGHLGYQLVLPKGTYTLSGCPDGGSGGTYFLQVGRNTGSWQTIATDIGEGATFTITEDVQVSVTIAIIGGTTVNNLIFKPMLEVGTVAHEYKPYTSTKLTKGDIVDNLLTGRADLPLSAKQGAVLNESAKGVKNRVSLLEARTVIKDTSVVETKTFDIVPYGTYLLFCQSSNQTIFAIYYINVGSKFLTTIAGSNTSWTVSISEDKTTLSVSNTGLGSHPWGQYILHSVGW